MTKIDDDYIKAKRALANAATPGPWNEHIGAICQLTDGGQGYPLGFYTDSVDIVMLRCEECGESTKMTDADTAFVADARTTVPELLDEVDRLRARVRDLESDLDNARYEAMGEDL